MKYENNDKQKKSLEIRDLWSLNFVIVKMYRINKKKVLLIKISIKWGGEIINVRIFQKRMYFCQ